MKHATHISVIFVIALAVACGSPRTKGSGNGDSPNNGDDNNVVCVGDDCENSQTTGNNVCGLASCDDSNACTIDSGEQDQESCTTSCVYESVDECVSGDGCCPAGCTVDDDSDCSDPGNDPVCTTECPTQQDECLDVVKSVDSEGCVVGCDYSPIPGCGDENNSNNVNPNNQSTNNVDPNNQSTNNRSTNNMTCVPLTCGEIGAICGSHADLCGGTVSCGTCSGNDECTPDGECVSMGDECDPSTPGTCPDSEPYCLDGTCRECVGVADCDDGELCEAGFCSDSPDCTSDPSLCPDGYDCVQGSCEPPVGMACDPNDPTSCPQGTFCDPATTQCSAAGGELGCGLCNPDCTCPNGLTCNGFLCEGCSSVDENKACPEGQLCLDLLGSPVCYPFSG